MVSIFVFWREKSHDSKYSKYASTKRLQIYHSFLHVYINVKIIKIFPLMVIFIVFLLQTSKSAIGFTHVHYRFCLPMPFRFRKHKGHDLAYVVSAKVINSAGFTYRLNRLKPRASQFRGPPAKVYNIFIGHFYWTFTIMLS